MKNKGFTVVEILTTFVLITIIAALLITISTSLSKIYNTTSVKTELYYTQSVLSNELNRAFLVNGIIRVNKCGDRCLMLTHSNYDTTTIEIEDKLIHIGDKAYEITKNSVIGDVKFDLIYSPLEHNYKPDTILNVVIPITYKNIEGDYGVNLVFQFNRSLVQVTL